jgi:mediator of replication checkpoint protein 1
LDVYREQLVQDDQELEKIHRDAVEGKLRTKRRNRGIGLDDSDDDDDDDDDFARSIRSRIRKKRKIEGDSLEALGIYSQFPYRFLTSIRLPGEHEETVAFYNTYQRGLGDEEDYREFSYLQSEDVDMADGEGEDREVVSTHEITRQLRDNHQHEVSRAHLH